MKVKSIRNSEAKLALSYDAKNESLNFCCKMFDVTGNSSLWAFSKGFWVELESQMSTRIITSIKDWQEITQRGDKFNHINWFYDDRVNVFNSIWE